MFRLQLLFGDIVKMARFKNHEEIFVKLNPWLYNNQEYDFQKDEIKHRVWDEIAKELDLGNGKETEQLWNLKKLLSQRRTKLKEIDLFGAVTGRVNKAPKAMEELNYLSWLFPFVKVSSTKSNLTTLNKTDDEGYDHEDQKNVDQNDEGQKEDDTNRALDDLSGEYIS